MEKKNQNPILLGLCIVLTIFVIVLEIFTAISCTDTLATIIIIAAACVAALVLYYIVAGYKKPHGNLLRYIMLIFAITMVVDVSSFTNVSLYGSLRAITILLISYIAGRLNKLVQNIILMPLTLALIIASGVMTATIIPTDSIIGTISYFLDSIIWLVLSAAYFVRFKEHKEAGLADAPKVK